LKLDPTHQVFGEVETTPTVTLAEVTP